MAAVPIPAAFSDVEAAPLLCAGIVGYRSLRLSEVKPGERLGLYGFGASAHIVIQVARYWGCDVYVFTRGTQHQHHALELGAAWVGNAQETPPKLLDRSILFAPAGWIVPLALIVGGGYLLLTGRAPALAMGGKRKNDAPIFTGARNIGTHSNGKLSHGDDLQQKIDAALKEDDPSDPKPLV